jgi:hypothetical protein
MCCHRLVIDDGDRRSAIMPDCGTQFGVRSATSIVVCARCGEALKTERRPGGRAGVWAGGWAGEKTAGAKTASAHTEQVLVYGLAQPIHVEGA